mgnify:CR=1 FL=1
MAKRNRIYSLRKGSVQWNEEDRLSLCGMLIKAGYAARIGRGMIPGTEGRKVHLSLPHPLMHERCFVMEPLAEGRKTAQYEYFVEYWEEGDDTNAGTGN